MTDLGTTRETARFPIQREKLEAPPLRDGILHRDRLLEWLDRRIHHRVVTVIAEAGYGKTTLLADFSQRTRLTTLWYRLDDEDRDPVAFLNYLVAAGRRVNPGFASTTVAMLRDLGTAGHSHDVLVRTLARELRDLGDGPIVLILDDLQHVDDVPEIRAVLREMIAQAPDRLTFVLSSRRQPALPLARLRARGELEEMTTDDLRFRHEETERLFSETYGRPLATELSSELTERTRGWAATLQLVRTAVRDRDAASTRAFILELDGRSGDLHDFLAEEVVGDLEPELRAMLMRSALLQVVTPELAGVAAGISEGTARARIEEAERLGLLSRRGESRWRHRYHPLVREFLTDRLVREAGADEVREIHRTIARHVDGTDWRQASYHWAEAGDATELHRVLVGSVGTIMGTGEFALANGYLAAYPPASPTAAFEIVLSRLDFYRNRIDSALTRARWAASAARNAQEEEVAVLNLSSLLFNSGDATGASEVINAFPHLAGHTRVGTLVRGVRLVIDSTTDGSIDELIDYLTNLLPGQLEEGSTHFAGVTELNLAVALRAKGQARRSIEHGSRAVSLLGRARLGPEYAAALCVEAWGHAHQGELERARELLAEARRTENALAWAEAQIEGATVEIWHGSLEIATEMLSGISAEMRQRPSVRTLVATAEAELLLRSGRPAEAAYMAEQQAGEGSYASTGQQAHLLWVLGHALAAAGSGDASQALSTAESVASSQGAGLWRIHAAVARALAEGRSPAAAMGADPKVNPLAIADVFAWDLIRDAPLESPEDAEVVTGAAIRNPEHWRPVLRLGLESAMLPNRTLAAELLEIVGEAPDVRLLRRYARQNGRQGASASLGRGLAKRLAARVFVEDLGRISISIGTQVVQGSAVRRKVLSLLLYLISRPAMAATRDQVLDALWPESNPSDALNSLNQTVYFLRRVIEPDFDEETTAGYVQHRPDLIWLDEDLISSRSRHCRQLMAQVGAGPAPDLALELAGQYSGQFALDFAYDDWAASYREHLHAAYLEVMERAIRVDMEAGHVGRAMTLARRAADLDPHADEIQLLAIRLSRLVGAHAAASERYAAYASWLRNEVGVEPPDIESL